jgi:hypothetical protein
VVGQPRGGGLGGGTDLAVEGVDQPQQGVDPAARCRRQRSPLEQLAALDAEQVADRHPDAVVGQHRVHLAAQAGAQVHQLGAVPHQLPQLPDLRRGDPRLRQPPHAQQIGKIRSVAFVVLHPPVGEAFHPQWVGQMHAAAQLGQRVDRPIPAIGRFQHHLRVFPGAGHHRRQLLAIVDDPHRLQRLPGLGHPHQHRATPMQIHPHVLPTVVVFAHKGPPSSNGREHPEPDTRAALPPPPHASRSGGPVPSLPFKTQLELRLLGLVLRGSREAGFSASRCQQVG